MLSILLIFVLVKVGDGVSIYFYIFIDPKNLDLWSILSGYGLTNDLSNDMLSILDLFKSFSMFLVGDLTYLLNVEGGGLGLIQVPIIIVIFLLSL